MENPADIVEEQDSGYLRLDQQIAWYDRKSMDAQRLYKRTEVAEVFCAVLVPVTATINAFLTALLGATVVILESFQQINQWSQNWITYRSTCESLRHEKYSYLGKSGSYEGKTDEEAKRILTQRVESLISTEHAKWISRQEYEISKAKNNRHET
jgi:hypothetical protein